MVTTLWTIRRLATRCWYLIILRCSSRVFPPVASILVARQVKILIGEDDAITTLDRQEKLRSLVQRSPRFAPVSHIASGLMSE